MIEDRSSTGILVTETACDECREIKLTVRIDREDWCLDCLDEMKFAIKQVQRRHAKEK